MLIYNFRLFWLCNFYSLPVLEIFLVFLLFKFFVLFLFLFFYRLFPVSLGQNVFLSLSFCLRYPQKFNTKPPLYLLWLWLFYYGIISCARWGKVIRGQGFWLCSCSTLEVAVGPLHTPLTVWTFIVSAHM